MSSDPAAKAKEYLTTQGFPFEMRTASLFQRADIGIHQSVYYVDPSTQIAREIDIIGISILKQKNKHFNIVFPIECKFAESPWIIFSSLTEGFSNCYIHNQNGGRWMRHLEKQKDWATMFEVERKLGYGLTIVNAKSNPDQSKPTVKKEVKDTPHEAVQKILGFLKSENANPRFAQVNDFVIYVPIIAIRGPLVEAVLDQNDNIECRSITEAQIYYREELSGVIPKIHVVTEGKLEEYIAKLKLDCAKLITQPYLTDSVIRPSLPSYGRNPKSDNSY